MADISIVWRVVNIIVAIFMVLGGIFTIIRGGFPNFIQGIFCILFGIMTGLFEFNLPRQIIQYASFMFSFAGRGIFYIFIGCITLGYSGVSIASGVIIALVGLVYTILHFIPGVVPPSNMQKATFNEAIAGDRGIDAHQSSAPAAAASGGATSNTFEQKTFVSEGATV
ncbi:Late Golgi vesicles protein [Apophysomyces sp. BC1034]|nr:Late Golgi vesicles protein [Apophysomyces sp. BC1015]KAG0178942.1 Late Golgi vesicles protein [Apophysomyces sp. BC1021]KAG0189248.1 Late Golgi vesicles protein [Apophysomyces sp. BC1034]